MDLEPNSSSARKRTQKTIPNFSSKRLRISESEQKRAGVITKIVLKNFMCHSLLEINFSNNASVIVGQNGSGKSAVLSSLILGLGGKASLTNRGKNVKGFVKAGMNSATIEITLNNEGPMAYRPNIYGGSITIVRNFTASGGSNYKIKSQTGKIITYKSKEIQNITTSLNIQIDNPICILNQDTSRNFLCSNDPKHKFSLFMRATRLEMLSDGYKKAEVNLKRSINSLEEIKISIKKMQEDKRNLHVKIQKFNSVTNLRQEEEALHIELLWAKVRDFELELQNKEGEVQKLVMKCDNLRENCEKKAQQVEKLKMSISELENKDTELKKTFEEQQKLYLEAKKTLEKLSSVYQDKCREKQSVQNSIKSKNQDIEVLEQEISNANKNKGKVEEEKLKRAESISHLEQKIKANDDILQTARNEILQLKSDIRRKKEDQKNKEKEIMELNKNLSEYRDKLTSLDKESGNTLLFYGNHMPRVKQLIERHKEQFRELPRGPLGIYIKLRDKKWAVAAEGYLGVRLLSSFICDNRNDNKLLMQIFQNIGLTHLPSVITSKFFHEVHNVSGNLVQAPSDCISLFNILEIEDPVVKNCIIDQKAPEGILLIPNDERAMELLSNTENVPLNCQQGITIKGDKYFPDPNYRTYCSDYHQAQYLRTDSKELVRNLSQKIQEIGNEKEAFTNQCKQIRDEMAIQIEKKDELEVNIRRLTTKRSEIRSELDSIRYAPEPEASNISVLENELEKMNHDLVELTAKLEQLEKDLLEVKQPIDGTKIHMSKFKECAKNQEEKLHRLQEQIDEKKLKLYKLSTRDNFDNRKIREWEELAEQQRAVVVAIQTRLYQYIDEAEKSGSRPHTIGNMSDINEKLENVKRSIRKIQSSNENVEELIEQLKIYEEKLSESSNMINKLEENVTELKMATNMRKKHYKCTEAYFINFIKHAFKKFLEFRKFRGSLEIDMEKKRLELIVNPNQGTQGVIKTTNLSGGEKSFSTVAYLYSLWQCMDFPFYFLDEFDVYMDKLNRTKVFDILLHYAKTKPKLQFVFLTPQDISFLDKKITILRLEPPKRLND